MGKKTYLSMELAAAVPGVHCPNHSVNFFYSLLIPYSYLQSCRLVVTDGVALNTALAGLTEFWLN